jgi:hypothetical protein
MRALQITGLLLLGLAGYALVKGISYTSQRSVLEVGEFKASMEEKRAVPPWAAAVAGGFGVVLLIMGSRKRG